MPALQASIARAQEEMGKLEEARDDVNDAVEEMRQAREELRKLCPPHILAAYNRRRVRVAEEIMGTLGPLESELAAIDHLAGVTDPHVIREMAIQADVYTRYRVGRDDQGNNRAQACGADAETWVQGERKRGAARRPQLVKEIEALEAKRAELMAKYESKLDHYVDRL